MPAESQPTDLPAAEPMPVRGPGPSHPAVDRVAVVGLKTDVIDLLQIHSLDGVNVLFPHMNDLKRKGVVRYIGITTSNSNQHARMVELSRRALGRERPIAVPNQQRQTVLREPLLDPAEPFRDRAAEQAARIPGVDGLADPVAVRGIAQLYADSGTVLLDVHKVSRGAATGS